MSGATSSSVSVNVHMWPGGILRLVLPLAVLEVGRLHQDLRAIEPSVLAVGGRIVDPYHHPVRDLAGARRSLVLPHVCDDHRASLANAELRAMALADAHPLDEPERRLEPGNRLADVGIDETGTTAADGIERLGFIGLRRASAPGIAGASRCRSRSGKAARGRSAPAGRRTAARRHRAARG